MKRFFFLLLSVAAAAAAQDAAQLREAAAKAFRPLLAQSPNFIRIGGCNSCHNQDLPVFAQSIARARGVDAGGDFELVTGSEGYERVFEHSGLLSASSLGYAAMLHVARRDPLSAFTDGVVNFITSHQEADGRWAARSNRQPLSTGDHHATAFAIFTLRHYGRPAMRDTLAPRIARAVAWLEEHPPVSNQDAAMQLMGLVWGEADQAAIARAGDGVRRRQVEDGGWAQLRTLKSDAYATGQSLYSLALAGATHADPVVRRGLHYLLRTQAADGTWHVKARSKPFQPYFESGFPYGHDQWISAAGTSWAAAALAMALPSAPAHTAQQR